MSEVILTLTNDDPRVVRTNRNQQLAADPSASAWVSANAGTGKTYVLVRRVLRLLLAGAAPERLLCLTYTKAAAAEMSNRLFTELGAWATMDDTKLAAELGKILTREPTDAEISAARRLFTQAVETPGGLKIQTIHAFCEKLLKRFPLEAQVAADFQVIDEATQKDLLADVTNTVISSALNDPVHPLNTAIREVANYTGDTRFAEILKAVLPKVRGLARDSLADLDTALRKSLRLDPTTNAQTIEKEFSQLLSGGFIDMLVGALRGGTPRSDAKNADMLSAVNGASIQSQWSGLTKYFLRDDASEKALRTLATKSVLSENPGLQEKLLRVQSQVKALNDQRLGLQILEATNVLAAIAGEISQGYTIAKNRRAALDYDDLIAATNRLLGGGASTEWVLYKLDRGIEHILIDEAQDTSPDQWSIISRLADEFFTGLGAADVIRTVFAVGDEKQSIYGFQGAEPRMFANMGSQFANAAEHVDQPMPTIPLDLSFRTVSTVLRCVDATFSDPGRTPGLTFANQAPSHAAYREGQSGLVELWETERWDEDGSSPAFDPLGDTNVTDPKKRLADRIASQIRFWLDNGTVLKSKGRPIAPGDILILVKRRTPFGPVIIQSLKEKGIPVAGADRIKVMQQLGVKDLVALGQFLILPEDDLSLACVLKSPIFGLTDDDLFAIACAPYRKFSRPGALWTALLRAAEANTRFRTIADQLKMWRSQADYYPPFEFFARLLEEGELRQRMIARLGPEAGDALDEFLNLSIQYDDRSPPSLQGFLEWLRSGEPEIKRDLEQGINEVRVMTVHGAKGLEAGIVFLPDTCTVRGNKSNTIIDMPAGATDPAPFAWSIKNAKNHPEIADAKKSENARELEEYYRLLYVAMTRAEDRLYIAGFETRRGRESGCWYDVFEERVRPLLSETTCDLGFKVFRLEDGHEARETAKDPQSDQRIRQLPAWHKQHAASEDVRMIPLAPSRLAPVTLEDMSGLDVDDPDTPSDTAPVDARQVGEPLAEPAVFSPSQLQGDQRFRRGILTHALLQYLPGISDIETRRRLAAEFLQQRATELSERMRNDIVNETMSVIENHGFADVFGEGSRAEVALTAEIPPPLSDGIPLRITGQIDRLLVEPDAVTIVDFKTNRPPPETSDKVALAYRLQLAAYRLAIRQIFPDKPVRTLLLWTYGPRIMEIPTEELDRLEPHLWDRNLERSPPVT